MTLEKNTVKPRKIWMKIGSYKHILEVLNAIKREISLLRKTQRYIIMGMGDAISFDKDHIARLVCTDEVDHAILNFLRDSPAEGMLPRDIHNEVQHNTSPWNVTLRIRKMNKKLDGYIGQRVAEKRGLRWCLTSFMDLAWTDESE